MKDIVEVLSLRNENVYCGKGLVDLFIGIDYVCMYIGEMRQVGYLVVRYFFLGWVIFGVMLGDICEINSIFYVKYIMFEDLLDFWMIEVMGVVVMLCLCVVDWLS